jgi:RimJ/RimL family protein N-acetyltransferase
VTGAPDESSAVLRTSRLLLREWRDSDRGPFAEMNRDPLVMRYFPGLMERPASDAFVDRLQELHQRLGYTLWVVEVLDSERGTTPFAGFTGLMPPTFDPPFEHCEPVAEVGWRLLPQWWGLGLATEGARASLAHGFDVVGLPEILSFTVVNNVPSRAVMERIGMHPDGEFDHPRAQPDAHWKRHALYRMGPTDPRM